MILSLNDSSQKVSESNARRFLLQGYRLVQKKIIFQLLKNKLHASKRTDFKKFKFCSNLQINEKAKKVWFHASSVGELEILWSVILKWAKQDQSYKEVAVTVFSSSAFGSIKKLAYDLEKIPQLKVVYLGPSPWEGDWKFILNQWCPDCFLTSKYEAWPDLWVELARYDIPLVVLNAKLRRSLKIAQWMSRLLYGKTPKMHFCVEQEKDRQDLKRVFSKSVIEHCGNPRWDQVSQRLETKNNRVKELESCFENLPRPWGVIGSAWSEDLDIVLPVLKNQKGALWVVPHDIQRDSVSSLASKLKSFGLSAVRTSQLKADYDKIKPQVVVVDEMGLLLELYSLMDWAYVGGGFGKGVHSTIEPALSGVPIAIGPQGQNHFSEVEQLQQTNQLEIVSNSKQFQSWYDTNIVHCDNLHKNRSDWKKHNNSFLGATDKVLRVLKSYDA